MEEYDLILKSIGTIGFPIMCCVWMATVGRKSIDRLSASNDNLSEALKTFGEAAGRHSNLLERIETKIDRVEDKPLPRFGKLYVFKTG